MEYRQCSKRGNKNKIHNHHHYNNNNKSSNLKTGQQEPGPAQYCVLAVCRNESGSAGRFPAEMLTELRKTNRAGKTMDRRRLFRQHKHAVHPNKSLNLIERLNRNILTHFLLLFGGFRSLNNNNNNERNAAIASGEAQWRPVD